MGVEGLDEILNGGLPRNRLYLIQGDPGVGKTTMAMQFLLEGARSGEIGLYVTLSETKEELDAVAQSHGWDLSKIHIFELSAIEEKVRSHSESTFFHPSEVELNRTITAILDEVKRLKPTRAVFDSLAELRLLAETPLRYRRQIMQMKDFFAGHKCTVLLLDDNSTDSRDLQIESIAHGVITLHRSSPEYGIMRRQFNIEKIRGVAFREGNHDFAIRKGGLVIFPRLVASKHHTKFIRESFASGIAGLDKILGGGLDRGTSTMLIGPAGCNKSTMATKFALAAAEQNEKVLFFVFDETIGTLLHRSRELGMDIEKHVDSGLIQVVKVDPAELSPGELTHRIYHAVTDENVRMIIIDSINGYLNAMPEERFLNLQLHELLAYLNQQGVVTIMVLAQLGLMGTMHSAVDLTYLADTVMLFRFFESRGAVKQALSIIKKRSSNHERTIREITATKNGIEIGQPLTGMQGILTGTPNFIKEQPDA